MSTVGSTYLITGDWREYWVEFKTGATTTGEVQFRLGREGGAVWLDHVGLYKGSSGLLRRDFQNGIAIVNGTWRTQTVELGGTFRKIKGTQDPSFNDGSFVTAVTLAPHDAIILLRGLPDPADADNDGFDDSVEQYVGTDAYDACSGPGEDAWPPDLNRDAHVTTSDVLLYSGHLDSQEGDPAYSRRLDMNTDGVIATSDILLINPFMGRACTP